jgi:predicted enzyme related to lactoylglutathione lyase
MVGGETSVDDDGDVRLEGGPLPILFLRVPDHKQVKNRLHFDLRVDDYETAIARAIDLGAEPADEIFAGERWRVLRDPEGNEFCIIRPKHDTG